MVTEQKRTLWAVFGLTVAAAAALGARRMLIPTSPDRGLQSCWRLSYELDIRTARPEKLYVSLPDDRDPVRIRRETFARPGLAMDIQRGSRTGSRSAVLLTPGRGQEARFTAEFDIQINTVAGKRLSAKGKLSPSQRDRYLRPEANIQVGGPAANEVLAGLAAAAGLAERLRLIFEHCWMSLASDELSGRPDAAGALSTGLATEAGRARAMVALCRTAGIPARVVTGFSLARPGQVRPIVWVEAYTGGLWAPYDPARGYARFVPADRVPVRIGGVEIVRPPAGAAVNVRYSCERITDGDRPVASDLSAAGIADLTRLPVGMRTTLAVLLLLPVGTLITAVFRNVVGISTYGTFTPALLALSFLYSDVVTGLVVFVVVLTIALAVRALLERLKLLMVPRLSVVLTVVVLCLAMAVSILDHLGLTPSARAVILPLVIMTMLVERFYVCREEDGARTAWGLLGGTLAVAFGCLVVLRWQELGRTFLSFPELQLLVAAALLLIGRYSGYRLTELVRFRDLALPGDHVGK